MPHTECLKQIVALQEEVVQLNISLDSYRLSSDRMQAQIVNLEAENEHLHQQLLKNQRAQEYCSTLIKQLDEALNTSAVEKKAVELELLITQLSVPKDDV